MITSCEIRIVFLAHYPVDHQPVGRRDNKGHDISYTRRVVLHRGKRNHVIIPNERGHTESLSPKPEQSPFIQCSPEKPYKIIRT